MKLRKRWYYSSSPHFAETDVHAFEWLMDLKVLDLTYLFFDFDYYNMPPIPKALFYYFHVRPVLEERGKAKELDEAFRRTLPDYFKAMPYDPQFGFYTNVSDSEDIVQIMAPTILVDPNIIRPDKVSGFCQPISLEGFPNWLNIPPSATWLSERVRAQNDRMEYVKVEEID